MRTAVVVAAGVLAGLLATLLLLAVDARGMLLDTDRWTDTTAVVIEDDDARAALATLLVDRGVRRVTCGSTIASFVAESAVGQRLERRLATEVDDLLASDRARELWRSTNRTAHESFVRAARTDRPVGSDRLLEVGRMLDDAAVVADLLDLDLTFGSSDDECGGDGVQVVDAESLRRAGDVARTLHDARWIPAALVAGIVAAVLIMVAAAGTIARLGIGIEAVGLSAVSTALVVRAMITGRDSSRIVDGIRDEPTRELAGAIVDAALAPTAEHLAWFAVAAGIVVFIGAFVAIAGRARRRSR